MGFFSRKPDNPQNSKFYFSLPVAPVRGTDNCVPTQMEANNTIRSSDNCVPVETRFNNSNFPQEYSLKQQILQALLVESNGFLTKNGFRSHKDVGFQAGFAYKVWK